MFRSRDKFLRFVLPVIFLIFHEFSSTENMSDCQRLNPRKGTTMICKTPENEITDCSKALPPGSTIDYRCGEFYRPLFRTVVPRQLQCETSGVWRNLRRFQEYLCEIDCGTPIRPHTPLISLGQETLRYSWPWHAALFVKSSTNSSHHNYICGGSLISLRVLVTAAHCVVTYQKFPLDSYYIVFGAISSNWEENMEQEFVQILKAKRKMVPEEYDRKEYRSDIALLELEQPVSVTKSVSPVCFPYDNDFGKPEDPHVIGEGEVVGYGKNEEGVYQLHLKYTKLPVVGARKCYEVLDKAPGREQFCAGIINGSAVCPGDSGGGMVFKGRGATRYYIQGIVSNNILMRERSIPCHGLSYFTNVLHFTRWVADHVDRIEQDSKDVEIQDVSTSTSPAMTTSKPTARHEPELPQVKPDTDSESAEIQELPSFPNFKDESDVCEFGCSHIMDPHKKYSLKDTDFNLGIFLSTQSTQWNGGECNLKCFELNNLTVSQSSLIIALERCNDLASICMSNVNVIGYSDSKQKVSLVNLKEFKLIVSATKKLTATEIEDLIFFDKGKPWTLNEITHLDTNLEIGSLSRTSLSVHRQKRRLLLKFEDCDKVLENKAEDFNVEELAIVDCEVRTELIQNTLTSLVIGRSSTEGKSIKGGNIESLNNLIKRQKNLTKLTARTNEDYNIYTDDLPRGINKLFLSKNTMLSYQTETSLTLLGFGDMKELHVKKYWERRYLKYIDLMFPNLKQLGIRGRNVELFNEALEHPSLLRLGGMDWECCFNFISADSTEEFKRLIADLSTPRHKSYFILERDTKDDPWRVDTTVRNFSSITAMFWNT